MSIQSNYNTFNTNELQAGQDPALDSDLNKKTALIFALAPLWIPLSTVTFIALLPVSIGFYLTLGSSINLVARIKKVLDRHFAVALLLGGVYLHLTMLENSYDEIEEECAWTNQGAGSEAETRRMEVISDPAGTYDPE